MSKPVRNEHFEDALNERQNYLEMNKYDIRKNIFFFSLTFARAYF